MGLELFGLFMQEYGITIIGTLLTAIFGALGLLAKGLAEKYLNDKTKQNIAKIVVQGVEQVYKDLHGEEKLNKGLELFSEMLAEKNIKISDLEMKMLLESAVGEFNKVFDSNKNQ